MSTRRALITGVTGQDGAYLSQQLLQDGWEVFGTYRRSSSGSAWRLERLGIEGRLRLFGMHDLDQSSGVEIMQEARPDAVFHLAGESFTWDSIREPAAALRGNLHMSLNLLEVLRVAAPETPAVFAGSSESLSRMPLETRAGAPTRPNTPYGIAKAATQEFVRLYRELHSLPVYTAVLFSHESPLRGPQFLTRKVTRGLAAMIRDRAAGPVRLGDLDAKRDWGAAWEYTTALRHFVDGSVADDLEVCTGKMTSVRSFVDFAAYACGFEPVWTGEGLDVICHDNLTGRPLIRVDSSYVRGALSEGIVGDPGPLELATGWRARASVRDIAEQMMQSDLEFN